MMVNCDRSWDLTGSEEFQRLIKAHQYVREQVARSTSAPLIAASLPESCSRRASGRPPKFTPEGLERLKTEYALQVSRTRSLALPASQELARERGSVTKGDCHNS